MVSSHTRSIRLGKIGFLNVLPIYYPIENGLIPHDFTIISGTPSQLNGLMARGELDISVVSSIEYARNPERYLVLPDLSISCRGPVQSVLLLSKVPITELAVHSILVTRHSHTSVALLRLLLWSRFGIRPAFEQGSCSEALREGREPVAMLTIGDEALLIGRNPEFPYRLDLGEAWFEWTGLPFVFALWVVQRSALETLNGRVDRAVEALVAAKRWGYANRDFICTEAAREKILSVDEAFDYYEHLHHDLSREEREATGLFFHHLHSMSEIEAVPPLRMYAPLAHAA